MSKRDAIGEKARTFFEDLWRQGDPWELESSEFEQARYARQLAMLEGSRYASVLEIGCGAGVFTRSLAEMADHVVALDIAEGAIAQALSKVSADNVDFRVVNVMEFDPVAEGPWDLVVMSETIYYLGWLYSFFDVAWLASRLFSASREGGRFLLTNAEGDVDDYLILPWIVRTYRDLFLNVGYEPLSEEVFRASKHAVTFEVLISLFVKPGGSRREAG